MTQFPQHSLSWEVGFHAEHGKSPEQWIPACVPGAVQLDWASAHQWPEYWKGDNFKAYEWMEDVHWTYRAHLDFNPLKDSQRLFFVCKGIDYQFQVFLGDLLLHEQEGMFTPVEIDLTGLAKPGDSLLIRVFPAPKTQNVIPRREQASRSCKPAVSYGWDFHPRLIPLGIWDETYLEVRSAARLTRADISETLATDFSSATVTLDLDWTKESAGSVRWRLYSPDGAMCFQRELSIAANTAPAPLTQQVDAPQLWWPHDQGASPLYRSTVELLDASGKVLQSIQRRIGFRRVRLVMHEGAWSQPEGFPKTRSTPPITLEINGRRLFSKGANWVYPNIFPGAVDAETYRPLLELARSSNLSILRCWGGAAVNKESFFEQCDELGIMVWQEFPLACNEYPDDAAYLKVLERESQSIIRRLRVHPSLILWCGGNELFNSWSGMTDQSLALRLLNRNCFDLDPSRPFLPTSPVMGMAHGHYVFQDPSTGEEAFSVFQRSNATAYTEFGCAGPASVEVLKSFLSAEELFPARRGTAWESHHAFGVWLKESHLYPDTIEHYCGPCATLEELVDGGQFLQAEGYKGMFEEARRQKPVASMALNWCLNEPWPTAANCSMISWPAKPKPSLAAVAAACRPVLASARISKFLWKEGELFDPEIWLLSDAPIQFAGGTLEATLVIGEKELSLLSWRFSALAPNTNEQGPRIQIRLPAADANRMVLRLRVPGCPEWDSEYPLIYVSAAPLATTVSPAQRTMNL